MVSVPAIMSMFLVNHVLTVGLGGRSGLDKIRKVERELRSSLAEKLRKAAEGVG